MRVTILGLPGSGKSTLAQSIAKKQNIPHIHIDRFWLEAGGGHNSRSTPNPEQTHAEVRTKVLKAIQAESWVSDGVYSRIQPEIAERADVVIFLDIPLWRRLLNHASRTINRHGKHNKLTFWKDLSFFWEMVGRNLIRESKIDELLETYRTKVIILRSRKEIEKYLLV